MLKQGLQICSGTANISDDINVYVLGTSEHDRNLEKVLVRLIENTLHFNIGVFSLSQKGIR